MTTGFVFNLHQFSQGGLHTYGSSVKLALCAEVLVNQRGKLTGEMPWDVLHPNPDSPLPTTWLGRPSNPSAMIFWMARYLRYFYPDILVTCSAHDLA